jgi:hypothetical protein
MTATGGVLFDAWMSYIVRNATAPRSERTLNEMSRFMFKRLPEAGDFYLALASLGALALAMIPILAMLRRRQGGVRRPRVLPGMGTLVLAYQLGAIVAVLFVGRFFLHYHLLVLFPSVLGVGWLLHLASHDPPEARWLSSRWLVPTLALSIVLVGIVPQVCGGRLESREHQRAIILKRAYGYAGHALNEAILQAAGADRSNVRMSIWGWSAEHYVQTGISPGTRDSITENQFIGLPKHVKRYFKDRYLSDLENDPPEIFVDAIELFPWYSPEFARERRHETLPGVQHFVEVNYRRVASVEDRGRRADVFVLRSRGGFQQGTPAALDETP